MGSYSTLPYYYSTLLPGASDDVSLTISGAEGIRSIFGLSCIRLVCLFGGVLLHVKSLSSIYNLQMSQIPLFM